MRVFWRALLAVSMTALALHAIVPDIVRWRAKSALADRGFPDAKLDVTHVGVGDVELGDVQLAPGLALGDVSFDAGLSMLWGARPTTARVRGAVVRPGGASGSTTSLPALPLDDLEIADSTIAIGDARISFAGKITPAQVDLVAKTPQLALGGLTLTDVVATAHGPLGAIDTCATGQLDGSTVRACGTIAYTPGKTVTLHVRDARVTAFGGTLQVAPFDATPGQPFEVTVRARGIALQRVLAAIGRGKVEGTGVLDGELAIRVTAADATLVRAELHARGGGTIRVADASWRKALAPAASNDLTNRITHALGDFQFADLSARLAPPGSDVELALTAHGRGATVPQDIDLAVNLRGVRAAAHRLTKELP